MMLWKCCTQYVSKFGKLSNGHKTGKGQFSFQSQRKAMTKNAQTTAQLHSSHTLVREGNGNPLQYSCLENPMDGGAWWAAVHEVAKTRTQVSDFTFFTFHFHTLEKEMATHSSVSCLENPRDGGAWWAEVYGVTQGRILLKQLSSSSSSIVRYRKTYRCSE